MSLSKLTTTQLAPYWINISSLQWILSKVIQIAFSGCLNSLNARMCKSVASTINQKLLRDRIMHPCIILLWQQAVLFREWEGGKYRKNFGNARSLPSTHVMKKENNTKKVWERLRKTYFFIRPLQHTKQKVCSYNSTLKTKICSKRFLVHCNWMSML